MADTATGLAVFVLADLAVAGAGANQIGPITDSDAENTPSAVVVRSIWNTSATVVVSDHPADEGDGNARAFFTSNALNGVWTYGAAKQGGQTGNEAGPAIVIPQSA